MKRILVFFTFLTCMVSGCNPAEEEKEPQTDVDVARAFIKATMQNDFEKAAKYMLKDEQNDAYLESYKKFKNRLSKEKLDQQRNAYPVVNETSYPADSVFIFNYSPSYNKDEKNKLKLLRINNKWLVDFKYTFSGNM